MPPPKKSDMSLELTQKVDYISRNLPQANFADIDLGPLINCFLILEQYYFPLVCLLPLTSLYLDEENDLSIPPNGKLSDVVIVFASAVNP